MLDRDPVGAGRCEHIAITWQAVDERRAFG
jgi:hypothetical protein